MPDDLQPLHHHSHSIETRRKGRKRKKADCEYAAALVVFFSSQAVIFISVEAKKNDGIIKANYTHKLKVLSFFGIYFEVSFLKWSKKNTDTVFDIFF